MKRRKCCLDVVILLFGFVTNKAAALFSAEPHLPTGWTRHFSRHWKDRPPPNIPIQERSFSSKPKPEPDWMRYMRPPYMPYDQRKVQETMRMIRDISKTWEADKSGPDVQPYQRYHVINDISSPHQSKDKPRLVLDKAPWAPLPRSISGHHVIIGSSRHKSPSSGLPRRSSLPGSPSSSRSPSSHLKVPHRTLSLASHDSRKTRGKWKILQSGTTDN